MKINSIALALILIGSGMGEAQSGNVTWVTNNLSTPFHKPELDEIIRQGIMKADASLPDLPVPWRMKVTLGFNGTRTSSTPEPGFILIEKVRDTPADKQEVACMNIEYGTYTYSGFLEHLRENANYATGYLTTHPNCLVNEPATVKKSSKK
ncbi:MAG: hypothetical protein RL710_1719 [Pseudomonadota bacterium]|jgi:hypothetical protein